MPDYTQLFEKAAEAAVKNELERNLKNPGDSSGAKSIECILCPDNSSVNYINPENVTRDVAYLLEMLTQKGDSPVYAAVAPAFMGQFASDVTPGMLRSAFKHIGFDGMVEVALFADILTLKEALEFDRHVKKQGDYMLTSCCCPMWVGMIKKVYNNMVPHMPPSISPMIACGRSIKKLNSNAKVVFIGPCVAKKAEAKEKDVADAVDLVLTFQEIKEVFETLDVYPADMEEDDRDHSSFAGRIYARTGGVSEAVEKTVNYLSPLRTIPFKAVVADGVTDCRKLLSDIMEGRLTANFVEGMGCKGGCVGGPKRIIEVEEGTKHVTDYATSAEFTNPVNNPFVTELLHRLGYDSIESLISDDTLFSREW